MVHPICVHLRDRVKSVLSQRGESIRWLSKQTNVDYQKLYRLESGDLRSLSFFDAKRIASFVEPNRFKEVLAKYFPEEVRDLTEVGYTEAEADGRQEALDFLTSSETRYQIYLFAAETPGANRDSVSREYGRRGLLTLDELLEKKALTLNADGSFRGVLTDVLSTSDALIKTMGRLHIDLIDLSEAGSMMRSFHRGLNLEGMRKAYGVVAEASHSICSILENPEFRGQGLMIFNLACGIVSQKGLS